MVKIVPLSAEERWAVMSTWKIDERDWNHGKDDFPLWQRAFDPESFLAAKSEGIFCLDPFTLKIKVFFTDGELLGIILGPSYENKIGFIGEYIVREDQRGRGIGRALWEAAMKKLEGQNVGISSGSFAIQHFAQQLIRRLFMLSGVGRSITDWYNRQGFKHSADWIVDITRVQIESVPRASRSSRVVDATEENFPALCDYDRKIAAGVDRRPFLRCWTKHPSGHVKIAVDASGKVEGYGGIRAGTNNRLRMGPLYADSKEVGRALIFALLLAVEDEGRELKGRVVEFTWASHNRLLGVCNEMGKLLPGGQSQLHFTKEIPACDWSKVYCLTDLEVNFV